jgi:enamine deaminase RidA (YjgF/YER057c/UK114 family)
VERVEVNPWEWSKAAGFSQAVETGGASRILFLAGQTGVGSDGTLPPDADMGQQVRQAFSNLVAVLEARAMSTRDIVRLTLYTTDVDEFLGVFPALRSEFLGDNLPAMTLLGISRLAFPGMKVELEATAVAD